MTAKPLNYHPYEHDGITDPRAPKPLEWCVCKRLKSHPIHTLPATSDEARARDDVVLGEGDSNA